MSTGQCSRKQCNSNLQAGPIIARLLDLAMPVEVSRIPRSGVSLADWYQTGEAMVTVTLDTEGHLKDI